MNPPAFPVKIMFSASHCFSFARSSKKNAPENFVSPAQIFPLKYPIANTFNPSRDTSPYCLFLYDMLIHRHNRHMSVFEQTHKGTVYYTYKHQTNHRKPSNLGCWN